MKIVSKAQARYFGAVAGGVIKGKGLSAKKAQKDLKGIHMKNLPAHAKKMMKKGK